MKLAEAIESLKSRDFLFLWLGSLVLMSGMQMQMLTRGYLVYELERSGFLLGLVSAGTAIPMLGLSLFGGVFADRLNRKRIVQFGQVTASLIALTVFLLIETGHIKWFHLLATSILQGAVFALMMPARQALVPQLVGKNLLSNAFAMNAAAMSATTLVAPTIAGLLYDVVGPGNVYLLISIMSLSAVILTGAIRHAGAIEASKVNKQTNLTDKKPAIFTDITAGIRYVLGQPLIRILLIIALASTLLVMPFRFLMPIFVVDIYHLGPESMGLLVSVMGGGSLLGSIYIAAHGNRNRGRLLLIGGLLSGVSLLLISVVPIYYFAALMMVPLGLGDAGRRTINMSLIMESTDEEFRGRVMSIFMLNFGLMPLGVLPAGIASDIFGGQVTIGALAVGMIFFTSCVWVLRPEVRGSQ